MVEQGYRCGLEVVNHGAWVSSGRRWRWSGRQVGVPEKDWESERGMDDIQDILDEESEVGWTCPGPSEVSKNGCSTSHVRCLDVRSCS